MKKIKKMRIIQISGIRGILLAVFVGICLVAGFVGFPGYVAMHLWNRFELLPAINLYQGMLLWAIAAILIYIANDRKKFLVTTKHSSRMTEEELQKILDKIQNDSAS
jgi:hypothetical protein